MSKLKVWTIDSMGSHDSSDQIRGPAFEITGMDVVSKQDYDALKLKADALAEAVERTLTLAEVNAMAHSPSAQQHYARALGEMNDALAEYSTTMERE